ncbi:helix-turn-helix domain-containing protein [Pasteurella multocida]|uniref:helix-turn-helix domain-containing protein n=2 Tax=Pasteurella multocida TaxID=747 RepID=UPI0021000CC1|nr:helix-turn-helix domain-containing protein [Pasteurella multocida]MDY0632878.1 hypothetical protein [Pasteurella multocida]
MLKNIHHLAQTEQQHLAKALNMEGCAFRLILISDFALLTLIQEQRICSELYYLFLHTQFELLPLKKRPSDILPIFCHYVHKSCARLNKEYVEPNKKLIQHLLTQTWQGNVKELIHVAELYAIGLLAEQTPMSNPLALKTEHIKPLDEQINEYEKQIIEDALIFYQGRINDVATYLNIPRKKLYLRMKKHHIDKKHYKCSASKTREYKGKNPVEEWVRAENVFEAIVPQALFNAAQTIIHQRSARLSDDEMLERLKLLLKEKGKLSGLIIDESENCPSSSAYSSRFGSLLNTYTLINYEPERDYHYVEINRLLRQQHKNFVQHTLDTIIELGGVVLKDDSTDLVHINNEFTASIVLSRCRPTPSGTKRWLIRFDTSLNPDITIAVRLNESATEILDYYLLPTTEKVNEKLRLAESNPAELEIYRHDNLDRFFIMVERILVKEFIYAKRHYSNSSYR